MRFVTYQNAHSAPFNQHLHHAAADHALFLCHSSGHIHMTDLISAITDHFPSMLHEVCLCAPPSDGSLDQPGLVDDHLGSGLSRCGTFCAQNGNNRLFLIRKFFFRLCQIVNDFHVDVGLETLLASSSGLRFT